MPAPTGRQPLRFGLVCLPRSVASAVAASAIATMAGLRAYLEAMRALFTGHDTDWPTRANEPATRRGESA